MCTESVGKVSRKDTRSRKALRGDEIVRRAGTESINTCGENSTAQGTIHHEKGTRDQGYGPVGGNRAMRNIDRCRGTEGYFGHVDYTSAADWRYPLNIESRTE